MLSKLIVREEGRKEGIQKVSLKSLKLGTVVVHAKLIFLYFQISAKQSCYGFTRGDYLELLPGFREILEIGEIPRGATSPRGATCPAALARKEEVAKRLPSFHRDDDDDE